MAKAKVYECHNKRCPLGTHNPWTPGKFTGGMTKEGRAVLGLPEDHEVGKGVCPTCGQKGKAV